MSRVWGWVPSPNHRTLICRTREQLPQLSPGCSWNKCELHIHPNRRRRNPHTAWDFPLGRILLLRCNAGERGKRHSERSDLLMTIELVGPHASWLWSCPPIKPSPAVDSETILFPDCLSSFCSIHLQNPALAFIPLLLPEAQSLPHFCSMTHLPAWM